MQYSIKTYDNKYWIAKSGNSLTQKKKERAIFETNDLALWYVNNTNVFGDLKIIQEETITITKEEYSCLINRNEILSALEVSGVDN